jgi:hypothetical protein
MQEIRGGQKVPLNDSFMPEVYEISMAGNDFHSGTIGSPGWLTMPSFDCPSCGEDAWQEPVWYASLQPTPGVRAALPESLPERVTSLDDYVAILERLRQLLKTNARLAPGSIVGALPVEVRSKGSISQLTTKKLKDGIDFIWANLFNCVVSQKILRLLSDSGLNLASGRIVFKTGEETFGDYRVLEIEPQLIWSEAERKKYRVKVCDVCGYITKNMGRDTYKTRQFDSAVFGNGPTIVRGRESAGFYINQSLYERIVHEKLTGVSFKKAGEYV